MEAQGRGEEEREEEKEEEEKAMGLMSAVHYCRRRLLAPLSRKTLRHLLSRAPRSLSPPSLFVTTPSTLQGALIEQPTTISCRGNPVPASQAHVFKATFSILPAFFLHI